MFEIRPYFLIIILERHPSEHVGRQRGAVVAGRKPPPARDAARARPGARAPARRRRPHTSPSRLSKQE